MSGAPETPEKAARRLAAEPLRDGYKPVALHRYLDASGAPLFWRLRLKHPETGEKWLRPMRQNGAGYVLGEPPFPDGKPLYRLNELAARPGEAVWVVEGETCADTLAALGLLATTSGGADSAGRADWAHLVGRTVAIWPDNDKAGFQYAADVADRLRALGCPVRVIDVAALGLPVKGDVVDWLAAHPGATSADIEALPVLAAEPEACDAPSRPNAAVVRCLANLTPERVRWLWQGRIARGKVTVLAGAPGLGKSQVTASLASVVSTGSRWPVDRTLAETGSVVILSAEDDAADTILPRMLAAGADVRRVHVLDAVLDTDRTGRAFERAFDLSRDVASLAAVLEMLDDAALVVIDPITAYLGAVDSHRNAEVRAVLAPLASLAARYGVAIVCVSHLNKSGGTDAQARVTGSLAFVAAARAAWLVAKDPQDPSRRLFLPMKNNLAPDELGLAFNIESATVGDGIETSRIRWHSETVAMTASEALVAPPDDERTARDDAREWLADFLGAGPRSALDTYCEAKQAGIAKRTLDRAKRELRVNVQKRGFAGGWAWALPGEGPEDRQHSQDKTLATLATFEETGATQGFQSVEEPEDCQYRDLGDVGSLGECTADEYRRARSE